MWVGEERAPDPVELEREVLQDVFDNSSDLDGHYSERKY
jgi:hypothetical protein